jgi:putative hydrolase of the HAD superfamily
MSLGGTVVCFDLDDTLVSECDYVESGLAAAGRGLDLAVPSRFDSAAWLVALWRKERARDGFQRLLAARGLDAHVWLPRLKRLYREHAPTLSLRGGAVELLQAIAVRGGKLALVTDGYASVQRAKWAALTLPAPFDPVVFTDERGPEFWKPHPWGFEQVVKAHPGARRFVYVGDNPKKDFIAPNRMGWRTVLVRDRRNVHPHEFSPGDAAPTCCVGCLGDVASVLP